MEVALRLRSALVWQDPAPSSSVERCAIRGRSDTVEGHRDLRHCHSLVAKPLGTVQHWSHWWVPQERHQKQVRSGSPPSRPTPSESDNGVCPREEHLAQGALESAPSTLAVQRGQLSLVPLVSPRHMVKRWGYHAP